MRDDYAPRPAHIKWLLDSDPAIRWQVMRDLTGEAPNAIAAERSRVATEGWGARLLAHQSPAGDWGEGPRGWRDDLPKEDRGILIALYSLVVLKDLGLDPASKQARKMIDRIDKRLVFKRLNNRPFLHGETEPCINGRILGIGAYFKEPNDALANQLLGEQLEDGGWNCEAWPFLSPKRPPAGGPRSTPPSACSKVCSNTNEQGANRRPSPRPAGAQAGRKLSARSPHVPLAANWRSHRQTLAALLVPDVLALRRLARTRLSAKCRNQTRQPRP